MNNIRRIPLSPRYSIMVIEPSDEAKAERQRKIDAGAKVLPFGFARALVEDDEDDRLRD